jgi:hypothetical protein
MTKSVYATVSCCRSVFFNRDIMKISVSCCCCSVGSDCSVPLAATMMSVWMSVGPIRRMCAYYVGAMNQFATGQIFCRSLHGLIEIHSFGMRIRIWISDVGFQFQHRPLNGWSGHIKGVHVKETSKQTSYSRQFESIITVATRSNGRGRRVLGLRRMHNGIGTNFCGPSLTREELVRWWKDRIHQAEDKPGIDAIEVEFSRWEDRVNIQVRRYYPIEWTSTTSSRDGTKRKTSLQFMGAIHNERLLGFFLGLLDFFGETLPSTTGTLSLYFFRTQLVEGLEEFVAFSSWDKQHFCIDNQRLGPYYFDRVAVFNGNDVSKLVAAAECPFVEFGETHPAIVTSLPKTIKRLVISVPFTERIRKTMATQLDRYVQNNQHLQVLSVHHFLQAHAQEGCWRNVLPRIRLQLLTNRATAAFNDVSLSPKYLPTILRTMDLLSQGCHPPFSIPDCDLNQKKFQVIMAALSKGQPMSVQDR